MIQIFVKKIAEKTGAAARRWLLGLDFKSINTQTAEAEENATENQHLCFSRCW